MVTTKSEIDSIKGSIDSLAIFGGKPAFDELLHVGGPNIGDRKAFSDRVNDILDRKWLTNGGEYVKQFEKRLAEYVGAKHCIAMCNATVGLEIAIKALELKGEVIVPSFTFVASAHALQWQGVTPVFCDVDPLTHNLDPKKVEQLITPRTTGIMGVNVWGRPCDMDSLQTIASRFGLRLLFDSAHGIGCSHRGRMIGNFGDAEIFSFHATKFLNSLEGGAVITNNDELAGKIRLMKNFGFTNYDRTDFIGTNGKMNEISAAMGLTNLDSIDDFIDLNRKNYEIYRAELQGVPGLFLAPYDEKEKSNYQYVVVEVDDSISGVSRDAIVKILFAENVIARRYFYPGCHMMEPYRTLFPQAGLQLPETEKLVTRVLCLPTGTGVSELDIAKICQILSFVVDHGSRISRKLDTISYPLTTGRS